MHYVIVESLVTLSEIETLFLVMFGAVERASENQIDGSQPMSPIFLWSVDDQMMVGYVY